MQLLNSSVVFFPGEWCSPGLATAAAMGLQQKALSGRTAADGSTVQMFNLTLAVQIRNTSADTPEGADAGIMSIYVDGSNFTCMQQQPESTAGAAATVSDAAPQPVYSAAEFMAALLAQAAKQQGGVGIITLHNSIALGPYDMAGYRLPMNISTNRTLAIEGAGGAMQQLDFGGTPLLLYLQPGSGLVLRNLNVSGTAHIGMFGVFANDQGEERYPPAVQALPTHVDSSSLFPTIDNGPNTKVEMTNVSILLRPNRLCSVALVQQQVQGFAQLLGGSDRLRTSGTTATVVQLNLPVPVTQTSTGTPIGMSEVEMNNVNITCTSLDANPDWRTAPRQPAANASQLLAALAAVAAGNGPGVVVLEIGSSIELDDASVQSASLPFNVSRGQTLALVGGGEKGGDIALAGVERFLLLEPGAALVLANLSVTGFGPLREDAPSGRPWTNGTQTHMDPFPLFPTINASPTSTFELYNTSLTLHRSEACTQDVLADQIQLFKLITGDPSSVELSDLTVVIHNFSAPSVPVFNATTNLPIGTMAVRAANLNVTCPYASGNGGGPGTATSSSSSGDGSGGVPAYVWAIVGVVVAATVAGAVVAALLIRRRQRQQLAGSSGQLDKDPESAGEAVAEPPADPEGEPPGNPGSPAAPSRKNSTALTPAPSGDLQDGLWRNRVGFVEGLVLGGVLGGGGYGRVYRGTWRGAKVAVKVVATHVSVGDTYDLTREPLLSMSLSHPNLLPTFKTCVVRLLPEPASSWPSTELTVTSSNAASELGSTGSGSVPIHPNSPTRVVRSILDRNALVEVMPLTSVLQPGEYEAWLVSEFADRGSLADAIKRGQFKTDDVLGCDMPAVLLCLLDVARGLEYLHSCSIVHGDLKKENVLLKSERRDRRGYVCKLGDFGLSRLLAEHQTHVDTGSYGTASIAAPELLSEGRLAKFSDIYAFGILLWELVSCQNAFSDTPTLQILWLVAHQKWRPPVPKGCPPALADLMQRCWQDDARARPTAQQVVAELTAFADAYMQQLPRPDPAMRSRRPSAALLTAGSSGSLQAAASAESAAQAAAGAAAPLQPAASGEASAQAAAGAGGTLQPAASGEGATQLAADADGALQPAASAAGALQRVVDATGVAGD
ncbi:hypothetical protein COHA_005722 [Chlorella ohadii]|uniref:Protein kinase domain-containing protein n=1 Tax=Chlorella ohadii TaxID=2649997 RepID=A0AAD5DUD0_9CHLO|nr:hypothetical protein COHA_005722 [Chlorella ohadii]